jgi:membrane protease YdiL (CAAX protease family)
MKAVKLMRDFPNPVVFQQISAEQPPISLWLLLLFIPNWLPGILSRALILWPLFGKVVSVHHTCYLILFVVIQMSLASIALWFLGKKYTSALWSPLPESWRRSFRSLLILAPLLLFYLCFWIPLFSIVPLSRYPEFRDTGQLAYGSSMIGVICESVTGMLFPAFEEVFFSGLLANRLAKSFGVKMAVLGTPACFALAHVFQFGFGPHLVAIFFMGLTYTGIRFYSGSVLMAVICHMAINFVIYVPKWIVAVMHFNNH